MSRSAWKEQDLLCAAWAKCLVTFLSRMTSAEWLDDSKSLEQRESLFWLKVVYEGGITGQHCFGFGRSDTEILLQLFVGEEVTLSEALDDMQWETLEELTRQWAGLVASELKGDFGEVSLVVGRDLSHSPTADGKLLGASNAGQSVAIQTEFVHEAASDAEPTESLPVHASISQSTAGAPAVSAAGQSSSAQIEELLRKGNLDLLMDVELAVMLRFGRRQTTLHEVLDLTAGAVLELDREIQEPVDLVLNERIIARGEVVVVDGNYGLRVIEVATPQQRVNSL